jgi:hypothetical protein
MGGDVRDRANAEAVRVVATNHQGERILEAERRRPFEARFGVVLAHVGEHPLAIGDRR